MKVMNTPTFPFAVTTDESRGNHTVRKRKEQAIIRHALERTGHGRQRNIHAWSRMQWTHVFRGKDRYTKVRKSKVFHVPWDDKKVPLCWAYKCVM